MVGDHRTRGEPVNIRNSLTCTKRHRRKDEVTLKCTWSFKDAGYDHSFVEEHCKVIQVDAEPIGGRLGL
jgi:hypothetical protein